MAETPAVISSTIPAEILLQGAQELFGLDTIHQVLDSIRPTNRTEGGAVEAAAIESGGFLQALELQYGMQGGRGLALRIGRAVFHSSLKCNEALSGLRLVSYRLQPAPLRLESGLRTLARMITAQWGGAIEVTDQGSHWEWQFKDSQNSETCTSTDPSCYLMVGFLQEFMTWAGSGRFYRVTETLCRASGSPTCVFRIDKRPLD